MDYGLFVITWEMTKARALSSVRLFYNNTNKQMATVSGLRTPWNKQNSTIHRFGGVHHFFLKEGRYET
jgi:hypothetical protein